MKKYFFNSCMLLFSFTCVMAQPSTGSKEQQDLERQRQQLKKEMEQTQEQINKNKKNTKEGLVMLANINRKLTLQENMLQNLNREINLMDNNIYKSQRDVNKMQLLLDTLKQEYAKSMVYAYKNRSNSDFLNFIFSAPGFNEAIKRINYLKSYRNYREMQGENILRTQAQLKGRIEELTDNKKKKNVVVEIQSKEVSALAVQQQEKNQVVAKLKAQGKELNEQLAAKKKQMEKVNKAFAAAIKRANDEARKAALAKAAAAKPATTTETSTPKNTGKVKVEKTKAETAKPANVLLPTEADVKLNSDFERNRGNLPWPVNSGYVLQHYGVTKLEVGVTVDNDAVTIASDIGNPVKAVFDGEVIMIDNYDDRQLIVIKHGRYFTGYSNVTGTSVKKGQTVTAGQSIAKVAANLEGVGAVEFRVSNDKADLNPEQWLKKR
jgi:murein hydrolase activator